MTLLRRSLLALFCVLVGAAAPALAQSDPGVSHDFDFAYGSWTTHISRLAHPLTGSTEWVDWTGTVLVNKVWNGRGDIEEIGAGGSSGHFEGLTLRLYDPTARLWRLYWASSADGVLDPPMQGSFANGRGVFYGWQPIGGRNVLVRDTYFGITADTYQFEEAFSPDGGATWEPNFKAHLDRNAADATLWSAPAADVAAGSHDFDWQLGSWGIEMSRLVHPLTGSKTWTPLSGTVEVRKIWGGRANLAEIETEGPSGHLQFLSLRLYDPHARQWSLNFAGSDDGAMSVPMIGGFTNGRGDFYDLEPIKGRSTLVRFSFLDANGHPGRDEQAFSVDGGKSWETNWINISTRRAGPTRR